MSAMSSHFSNFLVSVCCWSTVGILPAYSWPTVYRQTFRGAVLHFLQKVREEQKASGISTDMSEVENALENIIEKEDVAYAEDAVGKKEKERK